MDKITTTLSQLQRHFEKAAIDQNENDTKERARKIRNKIHFFWSDSLSERKELFWKRLHNQKDAELYEFYMQKRFVSRKFQTKLPGHCTERKIELHGNSAMDQVKNEIILKNRASEFKTQHEEIDNNVLQKIKIESTDPDVFTALKQLWVEDYEMEEEKSLAIWNKREKGLREVYDKEIREKIDGLTTKQDEQEDSPTPIPQ